MNKCITRYRRELKRNLQCCIIEQKRLLSLFDSSLSTFLEDYPTPTYAQLEEAFGPPNEMAGVLMERIPQSKQTNYHRIKRILFVSMSVIAALLICFTIYVFYDKEYSVVTFADNVAPGNIITTETGD